MENKDKTIPQGFEEKISYKAFATALRVYIQEASDEEVVKIWKFIAEKDPTIALKAVIKDYEKLDEGL